jgi:hypothetical protein
MVAKAAVNRVDVAVLAVRRRLVDDSGGRLNRADLEQRLRGP